MQGCKDARMHRKVRKNTSLSGSWVAIRFNYIIKKCNLNVENQDLFFYYNNFFVFCYEPLKSRGVANCEGIINFSNMNLYIEWGLWLPWLL